VALPQLIADSPTPGANAALTTLSGNGGSISSSAVTMLTAAAAAAILRYPGQFDVTIDSEVIRVTAGASGTTWTIQRGIDGSTAATHNDGAPIYPYMTQGALTNLLAQNGARLQNGISQAADLALSAIAISTSTGALTFTPAVTGVIPGFVAAASGLLVPVGYGGGAQTITPALPATTKYAVIGVEIDTTGAITLVKGVDTATQLNTGTLIAANTPATSSGKMRIADFAVWNNAGVYNFGNHTTVASQGVNWIDRRPWANGAYSLTSRSTNLGGTANYTTSSTALAAVDATNLSMRIECTGVPLRCRLFGGCSSGTTFFETGFNVDGANVLLLTQNTGNTGDIFDIVYDYLPAAGSHLVVPVWEAGSVNTITLFTAAAGQLQFSLEELIKLNANNGAA
jgi:hypothetical protein